MGPVAGLPRAARTADLLPVRPRRGGRGPPLPDRRAFERAALRPHGPAPPADHGRAAAAPPRRPRDRCPASQRREGAAAAPPPDPPQPRRAVPLTAPRIVGHLRGGDVGDALLSSV